MFLYMLYIITLVVFTIWMVLLIRRNILSWHSIVAAYIIGVVIIGPLEVTFNLLLNFYKFPTHLSKNPMVDNQIGFFFADALILPFIVIIFIHYALKYNNFKISSMFTILCVTLEWIFVKFGYLKYNNWKFLYSAILYAVGYYIVSTYLAKPIASYNPPIPRAVRLISIGYVAHMWIGATFSLPVFNLYQFKPGLFANPMVDDRFVDLLSGLVFGIISALLIPKISNRLKPLVLVFLTFVGICFGLYSFSKGWLIYHHWNHYLMALRYFVPSTIILLYDNWELSYETNKCCY